MSRGILFDMAGTLRSTLVERGSGSVRPVFGWPTYPRVFDLIPGATHRKQRVVIHRENHREVWAKPRTVPEAETA